MLPWKLRKRQILPVSQNLSSLYFSLAKFQLVSCNLSLAIIWQMTYTQKLPKLCSATWSNDDGDGKENGNKPIDISRIPVNKGIKSRLGWTNYSDLYEIVHQSLDLISLYLLTGAEYGKGLWVKIGKITNLHVHHAFLYISSPSLHDYNVKMLIFTFCRGREHKKTIFFSLRELWYNPFELPTFDELNKMKYAR